MFVDTGSAVTLLSKQIFDSLRNVELENESSILTTADEEPMTVLGRCTLNLCIANDEFSQSVMIADLGNLDGILGLYFLARDHVTFDTGKGVLRFKNFDLTLTSESEPENSCACVQLIQTCNIPGESEIFLKGKIKGKLPEKASILEPFEDYIGENMSLYQSQ